MTDHIRFDDRRSAAWREAVVATARADRASSGGPRKRVALVVGLVIAALVVSGGGVAYAFTAHLLTPAAAPTMSSFAATPTPTSTPKPTPTPTPSPTYSAPVNVLDDPTTWVIDFNGVGPVTLGSSLTTDSTTFPGFKDVTNELCRPRQLNLQDTNKLSVSLFAPATEPNTARTIVLSAQTFPGEPTPASPRTAEGIGLGSTLDQLQAAYPGIDQTGAYGTGDRTVYYGRSAPDGTWMVFNLLEGAVSSIQLGPAKTMPSEFCPA